MFWVHLNALALLTVVAGRIECFVCFILESLNWLNSISVTCLSRLAYIWCLHSANFFHGILELCIINHTYVLEYICTVFAVWPTAEVNGSSHKRWGAKARDSQEVHGRGNFFNLHLSVFWIWDCILVVHFLFFLFTIRLFMSLMVQSIW